jgi:hypothetical protein
MAATREAGKSRLAQVIGGGPLTYAWRVDYVQMAFRDDLGAVRFSVDRATGNTFIAPSTVPALPSADGFLFMGNNGAMHGSNARLQLSSLITSGAQFLADPHTSTSPLDQVCLDCHVWNGGASGVGATF